MATLTVTATVETPFAATAYQELVGARVVGLIYGAAHSARMTPSQLERFSKERYGRYPGLLTMTEAYELLDLLEAVAAIYHS